jgi:hypothetical protein
MKTRMLSVFIVLCVGTNAMAQDLGLLWAKRIGGAFSDYGNAVAVDASGNIYTAGTFSGTADFDPGAATYNLTSAGESDIFVCKLDATGNFVWARSMGGPVYDNVSSIAIDPSGNILTTGGFSGTADFDPGSGTTNLVSSGNSDVFVCKLDPSGSLIWAVHMGGIGMDYATSLHVDPSGNVITTGIFLQTADFDPGSGTFTLSSMNNVSGSIFYSKLSMAGSFVWAKQIGVGEYVTARAITGDAGGNIYATGEFSSNTFTGTVNVDFDPGPGTYTLLGTTYEDVFVLKLDASGNFIWANQLGGTVGPEFSRSINVDAAGNVITCGWTTGGGDFDPGPSTYTLPGYFGGFVSKLNGSGSFVWAKQLGGSTTNINDRLYITDAVLDASGNTYVIGNFNGTNDFDPGPGTSLLTQKTPSSSTNVGSDRFVCKLDGSGGYSWAVQFVGAEYHESSSIATDGNGFVYITGTFSVSAGFDPDNVSHGLSTVGGIDIFVTKLCPGPPLKPVITVSGGSLFCTGTPVALVSSAGYSYLWNTGANTQGITVNSSGTYSVTVINANGCSRTSAPSFLTFAPSPLFTYTVSGMVVNFQLQSPTNSFLWDFGNGNTSSINPNPTVTYAAAGVYGVCFKDNNNSCISCLNIAVPGNGTGGVGLKEEQWEFESKFIPNPFSSTTILKLSEFNEFSEVKCFIYDITGRLTREISILKSHTELNRDNLESGVYFYKIGSKERIISRGKVVVE